MTRHAHQRTSVSALMGLPIADSAGQRLGSVREFAVAPTLDANHVQGLVMKSVSARRGDPSTLIPIEHLYFDLHGNLRLREGIVPTPLPTDDTYLLLERDLLDQQIIDVHGHKVVRVNDVDLVWEPTSGRDGSNQDSSNKEGADVLSLRIAEVEIGLRGAVRRLLKGLPPRAVDRLACRVRPSMIPWDFVDLIDRDPARRVRLKIEQDRLSRMHPSDLADILEELAPDERKALFTSLDEEVAAETLEEVQPKLQKALIESLDSEQVAGIVEEMDPGAAADLLSELPDHRSEAILEEMDPEERQEVQDLLEFSGHSAAGRMTTEYIALTRNAVLADAITALRNFEGDTGEVTEIFLVDETGRLAAVIPLVKLLLASPGSPLLSLFDGHLVTCNIDDSGKKVAELFDKYNLRSLAVLDHEDKLAGVIYAEQVIALLRTGK